MTRMKLAKTLAGIALLAVAGTARAGVATINKTIAPTAGPWSYTAGGLNSAFQYGSGDQSAPTIISSADGITFAPGDSITVKYVGNTLSGNPAVVPFTDANGDTLAGAVNSSLNTRGEKFPSAYFNSSDYPVYANELVGTFANGAGQIVGTPFNVGDQRTLTVPTGATQLQLGINDTAFADNAGSLTVSVGAPSSASAVPLPAAFWPAMGMISGLSLFAAARRGARRTF